MVSKVTIPLQTFREYRRSEYRKGYPKASEEELDLLQDAEESLGYPPRHLAHARDTLELPQKEEPNWLDLLGPQEKLKEY